MSVEEVYDPLSQVNKHIMLRNGLFEFEDILNGECFCGHSESEHLINLEGIADCCLFAKDDVCICERFQDKGIKITQRLPRKVLRPEIQEDPRLNS